MLIARPTTPVATRHSQVSVSTLVSIWWPLAAASVCFAAFMPGSAWLHKTFVHHSWIDVEEGSALVNADSVLHVSIVATIALVTFGTWDFFFEIFRGTRRDRLTDMAFRLTFFTCIGSSVWGVLMFVPQTRSWLTSHHRTEFVSLAVFSVFLLIDLLLMHSARKALVSAGARTDSAVSPEEQAAASKAGALARLDLDFAKKSLWLIDIPVVLGVVAVLWIGASVQADAALRVLTTDGTRLFPQSSSAQVDAIVGLFLRGFATGSTTMHVAFSQLVFGVLKTLDHVERTKLC